MSTCMYRVTYMHACMQEIYLTDIVMGWCTPSMQEMCLLSNVLDMCETQTSMTKHSYPTLFKIV